MATGGTGEVPVGGTGEVCEDVKGLEETYPPVCLLFAIERSRAAPYQIGEEEQGWLC